MTIKRGEIYWLENLTPIGHEYTKKRPYLVVDGEASLRTSMVVCAVPLTTSTGKAGVHDVVIPKDTANALLYDSLARLSYLTSFDKSRFKRYIGIVNEKIMRDIAEKLQKKFSF